MGFGLAHFSKFKKSQKYTYISYEWISSQTLVCRDNLFHR